MDRFGYAWQPGQHVAPPSLFSAAPVLVFLFSLVLPVLVSLELESSTRLTRVFNRPPKPEICWTIGPIGIM